jgi:hypothetical protein
MGQEAVAEQLGPKEAQEIEKTRRNGSKAKEAQMGDRSGIVRSISMKNARSGKGKKAGPEAQAAIACQISQRVTKICALTPLARLRTSPLPEMKAPHHNERRLSPCTNVDGAEDMRV